MKNLSKQSFHRRIAIAAPSAGGGGAERVAVELANFFSRERGYYVRYIAVLSDNRQYMLDSSVEYCLCKTRNKNKVAKAWERCKQVKKYVREFQADCVISFMTLEHVFLSFRKKEKLITTVRNAPEKEFQSWILQKIRSLLLRRSDHIVFQTQEEMNYFPAAVQKKGSIIGNPIREGLPMWDYQKHERIIIAVGRLAEQKNWPMLLYAFQKFHKKNAMYRLEIYGTGILQDKLQEMIRSLKMTDSVRLCGNSDQIGDKLQRSEIYVSTSDYEGISNSMLEAMAVGIPVICTDCPAGGARTYIRNGINGFLIPVRDEEKLSARLEELSHNKNLQMKFSENERLIRKQLGIDQIGKQWECLL